MKGLIIIGSAQVGSHTNALSKYLKGQLGEHDVEVEIFDLAEKPIHQLILLVQHKQLMKLKTMSNLYRVAMEADFLILGTPNYHGSFSGILKMHLTTLIWTISK